ncbi:MAG TPA: GAF domain-containing protein [Gaiellaceae bacterium]|nr:GAF domain-containing protein [Gaiellaceae bacterium]
MTERPERLRTLIDAGIALSAELSLDGLLERITRTAAEVTGARYAALGVIDASGSELERFVTVGVSEEEQAAIGDLPRGRGILGVLIRDVEPLRLSELADDPRSVGFPPNHPPMHTFLGVPIVLRGIAYGNLYLTEKEGGGDFTDADEDLVKLLAAQAAVAVENARLYESATGWLRQLESLNEIGNALASEAELPPLLGLITRRLRELLDARLVHIALPTADGDLRIEAADGPDAHAVVGIRTGQTVSKMQRVLERRRSERVDSSLEDPEMHQEIARRIGIHAALFVPLLVRDRAIGVLVAVDRQGRDIRFTDQDLRLAETFASRAAVAVDLSQRVARDALRRAVEAQEAERRRLAMELHDETGQDLTSILLGLKALEEAKSEEAQAVALAHVRELVVGAIHDVRRLAVELRPKALDDFGLAPALERLAETFSEKTGIDVSFETDLPGHRLRSEVETALYRIVQEALTNVLKHAQAEKVEVVVERRNGNVQALVRDDGVGFRPEEVREDALGLSGVRERIALLNGRFHVDTGAGGAGTVLTVEVPE